MKRKVITLQFIENGLVILSQHTVKKYILNSVNNYLIINKDSFIEEFSKIIEANKINNNLLTDNINILSDPSCSELYKNTLKEIFKELSFNKIDFINIVNIFKPKSSEVIVDLSTNNLKIITKEIFINTNIYYSRHKQILSLYIKELLKNSSIQSIYIYGNNVYTSKFLKEIENICKIKTYVYQQPDLIPISLLI